MSWVPARDLADVCACLLYVCFSGLSVSVLVIVIVYGYVYISVFLCLCLFLGMFPFCEFF